MFNLVLQEELLDMKRELLENKLYIVWGLVVLLVALAFWVSPEDFDWNYWVFYAFAFFSGGANYGRGNLFPEIFSYVPITRKDKQKYILLRTGLFGAIFFGAFAAGTVIAYGMGRLPLNVLLFWAVGGLLFILVRTRERYYKIYKNLCGSCVYAEMGEFQRILFWMFRILDFVAVILFIVLVYDIAKEDIGVAEIFAFSSLFVYEMASLLHNLSYVKKSMRRLAL